MSRATDLNSLFSRTGFSLLEVMAALIISTAATFVALSQWQTRTESASNHSCTATRAALQSAVDQYVLDNGRPPTRIDQIANTRNWDDIVPLCPTTDRTFTVEGGIVDCPVHGQTPNSSAIGN